MPALPLLALTRRNACWQFSRSQTSSINVRYRRAFGHALRRERFGPFLRALGASLLLSRKGQRNASWFFCRLSLMSRVAYSPLPLPCLRRTVRAFTTRAATSPSADFCRPVRVDRSTLSRDFTRQATDLPR